MDRFDDAVRRDGAFLVIALRLMHVPFTFVNYAIGTTSMRTFDILVVYTAGIVTWLHIICAGRRRIANVAGADGAWYVRHLHSPTDGQCSSLMAVFPFIVRRFVRETPAGQSST